MKSILRLLIPGLLLAPLVMHGAAPALELRGERLAVRKPGLPTLRPPAAVPAWVGIDALDAQGDETFTSGLSALLRVPAASSPLEARLLADAVDGRLDQWALMPAALVASGVDSKTALARYADRCQAWSEAARIAVGQKEKARERAAAVLDWMHAHAMQQGYQIDATELTTVIDHGQFNCVSATVLFVSLATDLGLRASAIELPTHAYCRVAAADETFDVEPTCRNWFEVMDDPEARAAVARRIAGATINGSAAARLVSPVQLLAVIYYNRGVDLIRRGDNDGAMAANLRALALDPYHATARGNLWVAVNNRALGYCRDRQFAKAADLIGRARQAAPRHAALQANELYIYQQWSASLSQTQRTDEALAVLEEGLMRQPDQPLLLSWQEEIRRQQQRAGRSSGATP